MLAIFASLITAYFFYFRPKIQDNPISRLQITDVSVSWQTVGLSPVFVIDGQLNNNNSISLNNIRIAVKVFNSSDTTIPLVTESTIISSINNNQSSPFRFNLVGLNPDSQLKYSLFIDQ